MMAVGKKLFEELETDLMFVLYPLGPTEGWQIS